jgi:hypothetical protein
MQQPCQSPIRAGHLGAPAAKPRSTEKMVLSQGGREQNRKAKRRKLTELLNAASIHHP